MIMLKYDDEQHMIRGEQYTSSAKKILQCNEQQLPLK